MHILARFGVAHVREQQRRNSFGFQYGPTLHREAGVLFSSGWYVGILRTKTSQPALRFRSL